MAVKTNPQIEYMRSVVHTGVYKPNQGKRVRYVTLGALLVVILAAMRTWSIQYPTGPAFSYAMCLKFYFPAAVGVLLGWLAYRLIHFPRFAEFLIATEAEMAKVKWPTYAELKVSTAVVLVNILIMATFLFLTDLFWKVILKYAGVLQVPSVFGGAY